jgi:hypothetical protein
VSDFKTKLRATTREEEPGGPQTLLEPDDITFLGYYLFPKTHLDLWFAYGQLAVRKVGDELRIFTNGNLNDNYPLAENLVPEGAEPDPNILTAPEMTHIRYWGTFTSDNSPPSPELPTGGSLEALLSGSIWDEARNGIWYTYGDSYAPVLDHTTLFFYHLNDTTHVGTYYGPWRIDGAVNHVRGCLVPIPTSFQSNVDGDEMGIMANQTSGNATCPFGCNLHTFTFPDPFTHPPDSNLDEIPSIIKQTILMHDLDHRQARSSNYKNCSWDGGGYDCIGLGSSTMAGVPLWGGPDPESCSDDTTATAVWIDTPTKRGLLYFGTLCEAPSGYTVPGLDPDNEIHQFYGAAGHNTSPSGNPLECCHNQDDPYWNATGPGTHYRKAKGWIYDPADLETTADLTNDPWELTPAYEFEWAGKWDVANTRVRPGTFGPAHFDPDTNRIYITTFGQDTFGPRYRWAVAVFEVAS